jgi:uncharacterized protein (DUF697 family)
MIARLSSNAFRKFAKRAGTVMIGLIALDMVATLATVALGWGMFKR